VLRNDVVESASVTQWLAGICFRQMPGRLRTRMPHPPPCVIVGLNPTEGMLAP